jgi:spermidine synthase
VRKLINKIRKGLGKFRQARVIEQIDTILNPGLEVMEVGDQIILNSANANYSFGVLHKVFQKAFNAVQIADQKIENVLILGFGAGSVASILQKELGIDCSITGIEKDPDIIRIGKEHFNTSAFVNLEIIEADAAEYLEAEISQYDLIIIDVYVDILVPDSCESIDFVQDVDRCLKPGGMALFNKMIYNREAAKQAVALETKFNTLAGELEVLKIREGLVNKMMVYRKAVDG